MFIVEIPTGLKQLDIYLESSLGSDAYVIDDIIMQMMEIVKIAKIHNNYVSGGDVPDIVTECVSDLAYDTIEYLMFNLGTPALSTQSSDDELYYIVYNCLMMAVMQFLGSLDNILITYAHNAHISGLYICIKEEVLT